MDSNTIKNYINRSFQTTSIGQSNTQSIIKRFSSIAVAKLRPFCKPAMLMLMLLMILPLTMVNSAQAQETQQVSGEPEGRYILPPNPEDITPPKAIDLFAPKTEDILSSNIFQQPSVCTSSPISYGQTIFGVINANDCTVSNRLSKEYTFNGTSGQQISTAYNSNEYSIYLELVDPSGVVVAYNNAVGVGGSKITYTLLTSGIYKIRVGDSSQSYYYPNQIGGHFYLSLALGSTTCVYDLFTSGFSSDSISAYSTSKDVTTTTGCPWTAFSDNPWITIVNRSGSGSANINYSVAANNTSGPRRGNLVIAGLSFVIYQPSPNVCSTTAINYGQTVNGLFSTTDCTKGFTIGGYTDNYTFIGTAGDQIAISTTPLSLSPGVVQQLYINFPNGGGTYYPLTGNYTLPVSGTYTVSAYAISYDLPNSTGTYSIFLTNNSTCTYSLNPTSSSVSASGGTFNFGITATSGCAWTATSNASWLTTSSTGTGNSTISYTVAANTTTSSRTGTITVGGQTFTVTQAATPTTYTVSGRVTINGIGLIGLPDVTVNLVNSPAYSQTDDNDAADAASSPNVTVLTDANGNYVFTNISAGYYLITPTKTGYNFTPPNRSYSVASNVTNADFTATSTCTYSLSQNSSTVPAAGGLFSFNVTTAAGCPVSVSSNVPWLTASSSSNSGNSTITYSVGSNPDTSLRNGVITVSGQTFTVTQQAAAGCAYSLNPASASIAAGGGSGSFTVTTTANCSWTAVSNSNWLITSGSGSGTGTVLYTATVNTTAASRTGTITVAGQTFTVTQAAPPACSLTVNPTSQIIEATSGTYSFNVFVNAGCAWSASLVNPLDSWIHPAAGGSGNGSASYTVDANTDNTPRQGKIRITGSNGSQDFTVSQKSPANPTYSISGRVTQSDGNNGTIGLSGVTITLYGAYPGATTTDSSGNYRFNNLTPANYTVEPALAGALFGPVRSTVSFLNSDQTADFSLAVCTYSLSNSTGEATTSPPAPNIESSGGFRVNASSACLSTPWKAISNVPWIIVGNEGNGAGTQAVGYFVQRNYGAARAGTITVNGQIYTINQDALPGATFSGNKPQDATSTCSVSLNQASGQRQLIFSFNETTSGSFAVTTAPSVNQPNCQWSAKTSFDWIKIINPANELGSNNQSVTFTVEENKNNLPRFGTINVNGQIFNVVQTTEPLGNCPFTLTPNAGNYAAGGDTGRFDVTTINLCTWLVSTADNSPASNLTVTTPPRNTINSGDGFNFGNGIVGFAISPNAGTEARTGAIVAGDKAFTVTQPAGQAVNCRWAFSTPAQNFAAGAGAGTVNVSTGTGCTWNAVPPANVPWLHVTNRVGETDGTVSFTVDANTGAARSGTIVIDRDQTVSYTVTQAAAQTCSYTIDPGFRSIAAIGAAGTIQVTASSVCSGQRTAASNVNWITVITGANGSGSGAVSYVAQTNPTTAQRVGTITIEGQKFTVTQAAGNAPVSNTHAAFDFDGDGKADVSVFRPGGGFWYLLNSTAGFTGAQFGAATDKLAAADYDGDGKTDLAVYRTGTWFIQRSTQGFTGVAFGESTDIPVPGDYDGDGKADLAVYRPSNGVWYIYNLATNQFTGAQFGVSTDKPVPADYDGDGKTDIAVFRPSNSTWYLNRSSLGFTGLQFGDAADKPVVGDYDGDGKADIAVFRPSNGVWYLQRSRDGFTAVQFGLAADLPTPADYDGDGKTDIAVFRSGTWYLQRSTQGFTGVSFGNATDKPVPNSSVPQ